MEKPEKKVALIIETSNSYARGILHGIRTYIREHQSWKIYFVEHSRGSPDLSWLKNWSGNGIIARIENAYIAHNVKESGLPVIDVSAGRYLPDLPWVETIP